MFPQSKTLDGRRGRYERDKRRRSAWAEPVRFAAALLAIGALFPCARVSGQQQPKFKLMPTQFIAALGDPGASSGGGAQAWGLWPLDPGPRGVGLSGFGRLEAAGGIAPARWKFDAADWWLEENGRIMERPKFPLPPGKYLVTGGRGVTAVLTVRPADANGDRRWELNDRATLLDVTHLGCRSARYTPAAGAGSCSPAKARRSAFPVAPGGAMPAIEGCRKQDYAVLIVIGVAEEAPAR
jgi:hypothetical protein